jgi:hypothetical protein
MPWGAIFGAETSSACATRRFSVTELPAVQVPRLAATLPSGGQERLERLRGFGGSLGRALTCTCSRIVAGDGTGAVLVVAAEPAGPALTFTERVERLLDQDGEPAAIFMPDGRLVHANAKAQHWLDGTAALATLGLDALAAAALETGAAKTVVELNGIPCEVLLGRLGQGASRVVLVVVQQAARPTSEALAAGIERDTTPASHNRSAAPQSPSVPMKAAPGPQRPHPLRFVWDMDADGRFTIASDEFVAIIGARAALLGRPWGDIAAELKLDPQEQVANAVASRETWSGITVSWPIPSPIAAPSGADRHGERHPERHGELRLPIELSGFAEAIMSERFGPIGNERYREYIKDLHAAAAHLSSMVDDTFDLSKLDSGRIDLTFTKVNLNELVQQCVGIMQPQANRARIIIRSALTSGLPLVKADERALRQIMLNLLSNSIKVTGPGGQIIVSTVFSDTGEAILRVRDTGVGLNEKRAAAALEHADSDAPADAETGLPPTKALAEANHAQFRIKSATEAGTLVEIAFPPSRTLAA